jgi:hypothetical protein
MTCTQERIQLLADASKHPAFAQLVGELCEADICSWLVAELGNADALDHFSPHENIYSKAVAPKHILHIVSGNTPHAAFQSLLRGLLLGSHNTIKLPSAGLPDLVSWIASLPEKLNYLITASNDLDTIDIASSDAVIAIGSDSTIEAIQKQIHPHQTFIPHGHKLSIGIVTDAAEEAAKLAARDVSLYDQRGCLSLHAVYVDESSGISARNFSRLLADAMADFAEHTPPQSLSLSEAGAIYNFRETTRFMAANSSDVELLESHENLNWTVVYQTSPTLELSCLGRCVYVKPLPKNLDHLGPKSDHLSTIALHPFDKTEAEKLSHLPAHRICPLGQSQSPSLSWHQDGFAPLASLVKWKDIG